MQTIITLVQIIKSQTHTQCVMQLSVLMLTLLISLQLASLVITAMLHLNTFPLPWDIVTIMHDGFIIPSIIALSISLAFMASLIGLYLGGLARQLAQTTLIALTGLILAHWLAVASYTYWEQYNLTPYPWLSVYLYYRIDSQVAYQHYLICMLGAHGLLLGAFIAHLFSAKSKAEKVFGQAHFASAYDIHQSGLFAKQGIVLGKAYGKILRSPGFESVLITAPTGSGKTSSIAIPNLIEWQDSIVVNDIKGELYQLTANYRKRQGNQVFCFAPANSNKQTHCYNPFAYVSNNPELQIRDIQLIAETLIPATRLGDAFWHQSSREIFIMLALYLFETKGIATLADIYHLAKQKSFLEWLLDLMDSKTIQQRVFFDNAWSLIQADEKTQKNILKDFHSRLSLFADPLIQHATSHNDFDLRLLRQQKITIYLNIPVSDMERLSSILTLFWRQWLQVMTQHEPNIQKEPYGVLALIDEFGNLAKLPALQKGMSFLRSYRVRCVPIVQYLGQIISVYGKEDAKGFINTKIKVAFTLNDADDAQAFSKAMGQKTVRVQSISQISGQGDHAGSLSRNQQYQGRALMTPDELMQMPKHQAVILQEGGMPIKARKCFWFKQFCYRTQLNNLSN